MMLGTFPVVLGSMSFENACDFLNQNGVQMIEIGCGGCPGERTEDKQPNWVTCPWPGDFMEILNYQWNEVLILSEGDY